MLNQLIYQQQLAAQLAQLQALIAVSQRQQPVPQPHYFMMNPIQSQLGCNIPICTTICQVPNCPEIAEPCNQVICHQKCEEDDEDSDHECVDDEIDQNIGKRKSSVSIQDLNNQVCNTQINQCHLAHQTTCSEVIHPCEVVVTHSHQEQHCIHDIHKKRDHKQCNKHKRRNKKNDASQNLINDGDLSEEENRQFKKIKNQISCHITQFTDENDSQEKLEYQCQLFLVNRDRNADNVSFESQETSSKSKAINRIILNSNIDQLKTLVEEFKHSKEIILHGCPRIQNQTKRGSVFRGVSKNGKKWQVMVMGNNCKYFSGSITSERLAARIYDRFALQHFGLRAKTNLDYTKDSLQQIINEIQTQIQDDIDFEGCCKNVILLKGVIALQEAE
ncbi:ant-like protein [Stylonychia lemnae]|uniref:Ant-like protein n=1 Tax=Stylonychia lemnae TaxID=5949 RepID=A0A078AKG9_STYLE|nr:ant-like protein [Stylonychia lemnae]|eukprot:CDW81922.1 ant-like protein [Stylonychia lemnae]